MSEHGSLVEELMSIKGGATNIPYNADRDRFQMPYCADTRVNETLNANRIIVNGKNIAIATQYPCPHQIEAQLQMLLDNCTPVLIILASSTDIQNNLLPEYFSGSATHGEIQTHSKFIDYIELGKTIEAKVFTLNISKGEQSLDVPVLHVYNWPDHRTISPTTTSNLVALIKSTISDSMATFDKDGRSEINSSEKILPVIHCKAGVGRTGQTLAALALSQYPELTLSDIIKDLRASRNDRMIQTPMQMETLVKLESKRSKPEQKKPSKWRSLFGKS